jgi:hypothetical protein
MEALQMIGILIAMALVWWIATLWAKRSLYERYDEVLNVAHFFLMDEYIARELKWKLQKLPLRMKITVTKELKQRAKFELMGTLNTNLFRTLSEFKECVKALRSVGFEDMILLNVPHIINTLHFWRHRAETFEEVLSVLKTIDETLNSFGERIEYKKIEIKKLERALVFKLVRGFTTEVGELVKKDKLEEVLNWLDILSGYNAIVGFVTEDNIELISDYLNKKPATITYSQSYYKHKKLLNRRRRKSII